MLTERQRRARGRLGVFLAIVAIGVIGDGLGAFDREPGTPAVSKSHATLPVGGGQLEHDTPLRRRLVRAAMNLPPGASVEEMAVQAQREAEAEEGGP